MRDNEELLQYNIPTLPLTITLTYDIRKTSLVRRMQAQTLHDGTPPQGNPPIAKIAVTFELMKRFRCPLRFRIF